MTTQVYYKNCWNQQYNFYVHNIRKTLKAHLDIADALFSKTTTPSIVLYSH